MARNKGTSSFPGNFQVGMSAALDPRTVVDTKSELIDANTWPLSADGAPYIYEGMQVAVKDEQNVYMLIDSANYNLLSSWKKINPTPTNLIKNSNFDISQNVGGLIGDRYDNWDNVIVGESEPLKSEFLNKDYLNFYNAVNVTQCGIKQTLNLIPGQRYTLSFYYKGDMSGLTVNYLKGITMAQISHSDNITQNEGSFNLNPFSPADHYEFAYMSFTAISQEDPYVLDFTDTEHYGGLFIACIKLEEGDVATEYDRYEDTWRDVRDYKIIESTQYVSAITNLDATTTTTMGGIPAGTTVGSLNGKTYAQLFDELLFPDDDNISVVSGSIYVTGAAINPSSTSLYVGATIPKFSTNSANVGSLVKGRWNKYNSGLAATGDETSRTYSVTIGNKTASGSTVATVNSSIESNFKSGNTMVFSNPGSYNYTLTINYGAGPIPKNNKGKPLPGKQVQASSKTQTITVNVSKKWYATTADINTLTEQSRIAWSDNMTANFTVVMQMDNDSIEQRQRFKIPRQAKSISAYNSMSGNYENITSKWVLNNNAPDEDGYYMYYFDNDKQQGAQLLQVSF